MENVIDFTGFDGGELTKFLESLKSIKSQMGSANQPTGVFNQLERLYASSQSKSVVQDMRETYFLLNRQKTRIFNKVSERLQQLINVIEGSAEARELMQKAGSDKTAEIVSQYMTEIDALLKPGSEEAA